MLLEQLLKWTENYCVVVALRAFIILWLLSSFLNYTIFFITNLEFWSDLKLLIFRPIFRTDLKNKISFRYLHKKIATWLKIYWFINSFVTTTNITKNSILNICLRCIWTKRFQIKNDPLLERVVISLFKTWKIFSKIFSKNP